jgi:hypothetical protein
LRWAGPIDIPSFKVDLNIEPWDHPWLCTSNRMKENFQPDEKEEQ